MELPVSLQAAQFLWAAALGIALALFYDLLRALRRRHPRLTRPADALFCIVLLPALLLFALYAGRGRFRLFFYPAIFLGGALYFYALSPWILALFSRLGRALDRVFAGFRSIFKNIYEKIQIVSIYLFSIRKKWVMIK